MVACLPLVQRALGSIPGEVVNFHSKIFNLGARRGGNIHFLITRLYITWLGLNSKPFRSTCVEKAYSSLLLIAIRPSDGDVTPGGPLGAFRKEQAMSRHRV